MTLSGFKFIFFWEWVHRLLGRILGLVFFVGVAWFAFKRAIPKGFGWRLVALFVLGGLQGAVGWFMVMSGLEGRTEVSPYRLSAHLLFALFLFAALIWTALDLRRPLLRSRRGSPAGASWRSPPCSSSSCLAPGSPAFAPATSSNSWPDMNGRFVPEGIDWSHGAAVRRDPRPVPAPFPSPLVGVGRGRRARAVRPPGRKVEGARAASIAIHSAFGTQILLGILTVLSGIAIWLAVLHQATGALLVAATVWGAHDARPAAR